MAGADASIYSMIRPQATVRLQDPLEAQTKRMQIQQLMGAQEMQGLQLEEARAGAQRNQRIQDLFSSNPNATPDQVAPIDYRAAQQLRKDQLDADSKRATTDKARAEALTKNVGVLRDQAAGIADQAGWDMWRENVARILSPDLARTIPQQFTPEAKLSVIQTAAQLLERLSPKLEMRDLGGSVGAFNPYSGTQVGAGTNKTMTPDARAGAVTVPDASGNYVPNQPVIQAKARIAASGAPRISIDQRAEGTYAQKVAGGAAERDEGLVKSAQSAVENIGKLDSVIDHLRNSKAITGLGSDLLKNIERSKALFLQSKSAGKAVSDTELLDSMLGSDVFSMIQSLGIGARGMDTPAEREFLRSVMTGTTSMNKDTLVRMAEIRRDIAKRAVDKYNTQVDSGELDRYFQYSGAQKKKLDPPAPGPKPASEPKVFNSMPDPAKYSGKRVESDDGTIYRSDGKRWVRQ